MNEWDERYASEDLPWDTGEPEPHLVELLEQRVIAPCRVFEIGCGTGTNAIWLARQGFEVHGVDVSPRAIDKANAKRKDAGVHARFSVFDFLNDEVPDASFELVFDRGVFHIFDEAADRTRFAERVAKVLQPRGDWVSLVGSTEGPARDYGPPRRSARELVESVEPALELVSLRSISFSSERFPSAKAWQMLARLREVPAQPSTRRT